MSWGIKNNKIGPNHITDSSINKKTKNVNSNENNAKVENINNFNSGTDWIKFLEILNNLEIGQIEKLNILSDCKICSKNLYDKVLELTNEQNRIIKNWKEKMINSNLIHGTSEWNELENMKHATKQGVNINPCSEHIKIAQELYFLFIKLKNFREIKNKLLNT